MGITSKNYNGFQKAYAFFNRRLFDGLLPECLLTLQRDKLAYGYFWKGQFAGRIADQQIDEIALNPDGFVGRSDEQILSTLAHEMAHVWQAHFGKSSRAGYHNAEWANKMVSIGLLPTATGLAGGKMTGQKMTHIIIEGGEYQRAYRRLVSQRDFKLTWQSRPIIEEAKDKKKSASKTKFTCPCCDANAWAKPTAMLICGVCYDEALTASLDTGEALEVPFMHADTSD